jgi:hypothetical protein
MMRGLRGEHDAAFVAKQVEEVRRLLPYPDQVVAGPTMGGDQCDPSEGRPAPGYIERLRPDGAYRRLATLR